MPTTSTGSPEYFPSSDPDQSARIIVYNTAIGQRLWGTFKRKNCPKMMHHRQFIVPNLSVTYLFWKAMLKGLMSSVQNDILSLVAASIFADKRVFASEIEAFVAAAGELMTLQSLGPKMTKAQLLRWYEANKDEIRQKITAPYFKDWYYALLERLSDVPNKQSIIDAMEKISVADGSIHVSERALMTLAKRYWNMG